MRALPALLLVCAAQGAAAQAPRDNQARSVRFPMKRTARPLGATP